MAVRPDGAAASRAARVLASVPWIVVLLGVCALVVLLVIALLSFRTRERDATPQAAPPAFLPTVPAAASATGGPTPAAVERRSVSPRPSRSSRTPSPRATVTGSPTPGRTSAPDGADAGGRHGQRPVRGRYERLGRGRGGAVDRQRVAVGGWTGRWSWRSTTTPGHCGWLMTRASRCGGAGNGEFVLRGTRSLDPGDSRTLRLRVGWGESASGRSGARSTGSTAGSAELVPDRWAGRAPPRLSGPGRRSLRCADGPLKEVHVRHAPFPRPPHGPVAIASSPWIVVGAGVVVMVVLLFVALGAYRGRSPAPDGARPPALPVPSAVVAPSVPTSVPSPVPVLPGLSGRASGLPPSAAGSGPVTVGRPDGRADREADGDAVAEPGGAGAAGDDRAVPGGAELRRGFHRRGAMVNASAQSRGWTVRLEFSGGRLVTAWVEGVPQGTIRQFDGGFTYVSGVEVSPGGRCRCGSTWSGRRHATGVHGRRGALHGTLSRASARTAALLRPCLQGIAECFGKG